MWWAWAIAAVTLIIGIILVATAEKGKRLKVFFSLCGFITSLAFAVASHFNRTSSPDDLQQPYVAAGYAYNDDLITAMPRVGEVISFGDIQWRVLDTQDDRVLLLSEYIIDLRPYHGTEGSITWEHSDIRAWLNGEFYNRFSAEERARINVTQVVNNDNPWFGTPGGNNTTDRVFLLSLDEVVRYFGDSGELANPRSRDDEQWWGFHDQYDETREARIAPSEERTFTFARQGEAITLNDGSHWWWLLRSPGFSNFAAHVSGHVNVHGGDIYGIGGGIRPAMWVEWQ